MTSNMNTVLLFGTFDFLHSGHLYAFEEAKKLGETLIVSIASDVAVEKIKGKKPIHLETERLELVQHIDIVDSAFIGDNELGVYSFFSEVQPDIIAVGYDQKELQTDLQIFLKKHGHKTQLILLPIYKEGKTKSSSIKADLGL